MRKKDSIAKITRPAGGGLLARPRLCALLDRKRESSLIFVTSPAGSGKTSLIASYLDTRKIPCLWYKIDEGDADIATFFHYLGVAAKKMDARKRKLLPAFSPEYLKCAPVFSRRYFEDLFARVKTPFVFVFDNYQDVPQNSGFHEMLSLGLADIPEEINVIFLSRKAPPLPFAHMYADNRICFLRWDEICFSFEETRDFVRMKMPGNSADETVRRLHKKTDGWVAGLVLMIERFRTALEKDGVDEIASSDIFDYFAYEIFQKVDPEMQEFFLKTAFFPEMTVRMAEQLTKIRRSEKILKGLSKDRYFTETYFNKKPVYRYHPLFAEFLKSMAKEFFDAEELCHIKVDAALLLEESENIEDAVELLRECGDTEGLTGLVLNSARALVEQGRYQTLYNWLNSLPGGVLVENPWLCYWTGVSRMPFNPDEGMIHFEIAFDRFRSAKEAEGTFLAWCGVVESIMYGSEGLKPLDRWVFIIDELLDEFKGFHSGYVEANVTFSMIRALALRRPAGFDMRKWADRLQVIAQTSADVPIKIRALIMLACFLYSEGKLQQVGIVLESLTELLNRHDVPPLSRLTVDWVRAAYFNTVSLNDECQKAVSQGLQLADTLNINLMAYLLLGHSVLSSLKRGDFEMSKQNLQKMAAALSLLKPWEANFYHYCSAWAALCRNDLAHAFTHTEHCMRLSEGSGNPWSLSLACVLKAHVAFAFGEPGKAMRYTTQAHSIGIKSKNQFTPFICLMTKGYFHLKQGRDLRALESIREGLRMGRERGFVSLFMSQDDVLKTILSKAIESGIEKDYTKYLITRNGIIPEPSSDSDEWPWPLKFFTFGGFGIMKDGRPVRFSGKVQQKPLSMLKALIAFGGKGVTEELLADMLWPEADGDSAHSAFGTTLWRLRRLLGIDKAIRFQEGRASLDTRYCWADLWAFERLIDEADALSNDMMKRSDRDRFARIAGRAIKMYAGAFLPDGNEPWAVSIRERLRNKFLGSVRRLGRCHEEAGEVEKAMECYQKGLEADDLAEDFYRRIMRCHLKLGRRAEALSAYRRCSAILLSVLGIVPSPETEALRREIQNR